MADRTSIIFPVGRLVQGNLTEPRRTDSQGRPLTIKAGPNAGQPRVDYFFAVAFAKTRPHWREEAWGAPIWAAGAAAFPQHHQASQFAWKVEDGDSLVPNLTGRVPARSEGFPGHWVVRFTGGTAPRLYTRDATGTPIQGDGNLFKLGYFVQVSGNVVGNNSPMTPGVYVNHGMVMFVGYGPEIIVGPNALEVFGAAPAALPPGATAVPAAVAMPAAAPAAVPAPAAVAPPVVVAPAPHMLAMPPAAPVAPPVPTAAGPVMTAKAGGVPHAEWIKQGWTDTLLREHGYLI